MKKFISYVLVLAIALSGTLMSGCDSQRTLQIVAKSNVRLSALTAEAGRAFNRAVEEGRLGDEDRRKAAESLQKIVDGGKIVTAALRDLSEKYPDGKIPVDAVSTLDVLFSTSVVLPTLDLLTLVGAITKDKSDYLAVAVLAIKSLVLSVAGRLNSKSAEILRTGGESYA